MFTRIHLASIDVKSEGSILIKETVTHSHCVFKEICGALCIVRENFYYLLLGLVKSSHKPQRM